MVRFSCSAVAISLLLLSRVAVAAPIPLVNISPATGIAQSPGPNQFFGFDEGNINGTWGWSFYVKSPITITSVAWYDENADGLSHSHSIGLWKDLTGKTNWPYVTSTAQQLLGASGIVIPTGTVAALDGPWRKVALPTGPISLSPGGYFLGGLDNANSTDAIRYGLDHSTPGFPTRMPADPRIDVGAPGSLESGFGVPSSFILVSGVELGPMLFVEPVPEPTTIAMALSIGCLAIGSLTMRRRRDKARQG